MRGSAAGLVRQRLSSPLLRRQAPAPDSHEQHTGQQLLDSDTQGAGARAPRNVIPSSVCSALMNTCMMTCSGACAAGNWPGSWKWRTMPGACGGAGRCSAERSDMGALAGHKRDGAVCTPGSVFRYLLRSGMCWTAAASAGPEPAPQVHVGHAAGRTALPAVPVPARGQVLGPRAPLRPTPNCFGSGLPRRAASARCGASRPWRSGRTAPAERTRLAQTRFHVAETRRELTRPLENLSPHTAGRTSSFDANITGGLCAPRPLLAKLPRDAALCVCAQQNVGAVHARACIRNPLLAVESAVTTWTANSTDCDCEQKRALTQQRCCAVTVSLRTCGEAVSSRSRTLGSECGSDSLSPAASSASCPPLPSAWPYTAPLADASRTGSRYAAHIAAALHVERPQRALNILLERERAGCSLAPFQGA